MRIKSLIHSVIAGRLQIHYWVVDHIDYISENILFPPEPQQSLPKLSSKIIPHKFLFHLRKYPSNSVQQKNQKMEETEETYNFPVETSTLLKWNLLGILFTFLWIFI